MISASEPRQPLIIIKTGLGTLQFAKHFNDLSQDPTIFQKGR